MDSGGARDAGGSGRGASRVIDGPCPLDAVGGELGSIPFTNRVQWRILRADQLFAPVASRCPAVSRNTSPLTMPRGRTTGRVPLA